jgi:hypothetical protein
VQWLAQATLKVCSILEQWTRFLMYKRFRTFTVIKNILFLLPKHSGNFDMLNFTRNFVLSLLKLRVSGFSFQNFRISSRSFGFSTRNFVFSNRPTETSGVDSGIFCYRNFRSAEVSNEVSIERKPEKFSKFQAKMNYCVGLTNPSCKRNKKIPKI